MKPQPTIERRPCKHLGDASHELTDEIKDLLATSSNPIWSLFEGSDWYQWRNVAFRGVPCDRCVNPQPPPPEAEHARISYQEGRAERDFFNAATSTKCGKCHGWDVTPIDGEIEWMCRGGCSELDCRGGNLVDGEPGAGHTPQNLGCGWMLVLQIDKDGGT